MLAYLKDQAAPLLIRFMESGEPFIPDVGSVTWSLRGHAGTLVPGYVDTPLSTGVTDVEKVLTVPALQNTITGTNFFEKRSVIVSALRAGRPWSSVVHYQVIPWLLHTVTPQSARALIGLDQYDLDDSEIDIFGAYLFMRNRLTDTVIVAALSAGTQVEARANRAIGAKAILDALPALSNRILKSKTDGTIKAERFKFDIELMRRTLQGYVDDAVFDALGDNGASTLAYSFGTPTDVITG